MVLSKRYLEVIVLTGINGELTPLYINWNTTNGIKTYKIDKILNVSKKASLAGGCGICYCCMIAGKRKNLFYERERWFIEYNKY